MRVRVMQPAASISLRHQAHQQSHDTICAAPIFDPVSRVNLQLIDQLQQQQEQQRRQRRRRH